MSDTKPVEKVEAVAADTPMTTETEAEIMHKRKAYRLQQEENRKKLKTVKFDEKEKDDSAQLPKVCYSFEVYAKYTKNKIVYSNHDDSRKNTTANVLIPTHSQITNWSTPNLPRICLGRLFSLLSATILLKKSLLPILAADSVA